MSSQAQENFLNADTEIKGNLKFSNALNLDGKIEGHITSDGRFSLGATGEVKGDIQVGHAIIEGKVEGNINAKEKVELKANAQLLGDLRASRLVIEEGVVISGKCEVNPEGRKMTDAFSKAGKVGNFSELVEKK